MTYTIKIQDKSLKAKSIINMLKALEDDYDFIEIQKDSKNVTSFNLDKELDKRYKSFQKSPNGKDWIDLKKELKENKKALHSTDFNIFAMQPNTRFERGEFS